MLLTYLISSEDLSRQKCFASCFNLSSSVLSALVRTVYALSLPVAALIRIRR